MRASRGARQGQAQAMADRRTPPRLARALLTIGFTEFAESVGTPPKSLIRMFSPMGNPTAENLFKVVSHLQTRAGIELHVA
jgi:DNA-binding phage protein